MDIKRVEPDDVAKAITRTLREIYGQDVHAILMWLPPGLTKMDFFSNGDPPKIIRALRQAADFLESLPPGAPIPRERS